jgi:uncharacterized membrane protein YeaQ/YmgE (transglycosylase-associated protein family)
VQPVRQYATEQIDLRNFTSDFFGRGPLRSNYFIMGTILMGIDFAMVGLVLFRFWSQMRTVAILQLGLAVVGMLMLWSRAYVTCRRLREVYSQAKSDPSFAHSPLDTSLRNAAAITGASLYFSFFVAAWLLLALYSSLRGH